MKVVAIHPVDDRKKIELPLVYPNVSAGFPSPAENYFEERLDLNSLLIKKPLATFYVRVDGDSMIEAGIYPGDILVVDRSIKPCNNSIVVAAVDSELVVKRLIKERNKTYLAPDNSQYPPIELDENNQIVIWGVATYNIHRLLSPP